MIYDAMYRYWFIDNATKIPNIFDRREGDEIAEKEENVQMQHERSSGRRSRPAVARGRPRAATVG
jgi:hypothetical protein